MNKAQRERFQRAGWKVGTVGEFFDLTPAEEALIETKLRLGGLVRAAGDGNECEITVADNGPGLPPDALEKVFDKFFRVPGSRTGGTGLGLSIARGFVEAHRGTIKAENRPGGGLRFVIRLPLEKYPVPESR